MYYVDYKKVRNKTWEVLLNCKINSLPVNLAAVAIQYDIKIIPYSSTSFVHALKQEALSGDGFSANVKDKKIIFINDRISNNSRRRFTLAHELGHCILGHPLDNIQFRTNEFYDSKQALEAEANVFARDLLMPAVVLAKMDIHNVDEIVKLCKVSNQSATIRAERLAKLYERNMFCKHPYEKAIVEQFKEYIEQFKL